jgi:phage tail sheath protein FI
MDWRSQRIEKGGSMPEYLAPGVFVEEVSFRSKSIEGVSTTTTGFVGPTRYGPIDMVPDVITSLGDFELTYGDRKQLQYIGDTGTTVSHNFMWHAVRAFFQEGGKRLYCVRTFRPFILTDAGAINQKPDHPPVYTYPAATIEKTLPKKLGGLTVYEDGHARKLLGSSTTPPAPPADTDKLIQIRARFPGEAGNMRVVFTLHLGQNILGGKKRTSATTTDKASTPGVLNNDIVWIKRGTAQDFYIATSDTAENTWRFGKARQKDKGFDPNQPVSETNKKDLRLNTDDGKGLDPSRDSVHIVTLTVTLTMSDGPTLVWDNLAPDFAHTRNDQADSIFDFFANQPANVALARTLPIVILKNDKLENGLDVLTTLFPGGDQSILKKVSDTDPKIVDWKSDPIDLEGGNDGLQSSFVEYEGVADLTRMTKTGLVALEDIDDISIVAAPGSTVNYSGTPRIVEVNTIISSLITHAEHMKYRIAILDSGDNLPISEVRKMRAQFDSKHAALYYPWVRILDPVTRVEINLPPSGFVAGIYARNDITRAVYKAPANEVVNPEGINCFRFFEGRGYRLWGARTISSDSEWKYVNLRRYFAYLEHSIDKGTQFAVFEPNGPLLWANVRRTIEDFLLNEWQNGALLGDKPETAYFVRCDRSTMTQNDLDNGRLIVLIGVAPVRPAEFVIFRIGQWTGDRRG